MRSYGQLSEGILVKSECFRIQIQDSDLELKQNLLKTQTHPNKQEADLKKVAAISCKSPLNSILHVNFWCVCLTAAKFEEIGPGCSNTIHK